MPLPEKFDRVPPVTVISPTTKSVADSDRVIVIVAVSPAFRVALLLVIAIVGGVVSTLIVLTVIVTVLLASEPSALELPAASENLLLSTNTTPFAVELALGVKVAV